MHEIFPSDPSLLLMVISTLSYDLLTLISVTWNPRVPGKSSSRIVTLV
jgi:hypothetical protein